MIYNLIYNKQKIVKYFFGVIYLIINSIAGTMLFSYVLWVMYVKKLKTINPLISRLEKKNVLVVTSFALSYDGRVKNCINFFLENGFSVTTLNPEDCLDDINSTQPLQYNLNSSGFSRSFLFFPFFFDIKMFLQIITNPSNILHCHDIPSAFMGLISKTIRKEKILIVDFHEWWSETATVNCTTGSVKRISFFKRNICKVIENLLIKHADYLITVSKHVAHNLKEQAKRKKKFIIIKNLPAISNYFNNYLDIRALLKIPDYYFVIYYIGQLGHHRKVDIFIKALAKTPNVCLVFRVTNHHIFEEIYNPLMEQMNCKNRVYFLPPVPPEYVVNSCLGADLGLNCFSVTSKNMQAALPNKIFEYTLAGIPILSVSNKAIDKIVNGKKIGATFKNENSVDEVVRFIQKLSNNKQFYAEFKSNVMAYREEIKNNKPYEELSRILNKC